MLVPILITIVASIVIVAIIWAVVEFKVIKTQKELFGKINKDFEDDDDDHFHSL